MEMLEAIKILLGETAAQCGTFNPDCARCQAVERVAKEYGYELADFFDDAPDAK